MHFIKLLGVGNIKAMGLSFHNEFGEIFVLFTDSPIIILVFGLDCPKEKGE
jgi:hypothetical protein